jgi:exodeoxyribonuclease VII large subunit
VGVRVRAKSVYFDLRDGDGAVAVSMWRTDFDRLRLPEGALADGTQVVVGGGVDYYPGSRTSSGAFSFRAVALRVAGEGDLLAQIARLRRRLGEEGLFAPQKTLPRPQIPRTIGVVTAETGEARNDVLAGLRRRGWAGRVVWAFAPVQDRHAAPRITQALQDLAATGAVDVIVVARGGGSVADLMAFSDETLCRTIALLRTPVIAAVGHDGDRTLIDDVAAVSCSTPTHAADAAVPLDVVAARESLRRCGARLGDHGRSAVLVRARALEQLARAPADHVRRHRARLHQVLREMRASSRRVVTDGERGSRDAARRIAARASAGATGAEAAARASTLGSFASALAAHDPERVVERGFVVVDDGAGNVVTSAADAWAAGHVRLFFRDSPVGATVDPEPPPPRPEELREQPLPS